MSVFHPRAVHVLAGVVCLVTASFVPVTAMAMNPAGARYLEDTDQIFWFVHITDSHIGMDYLNILDRPDMERLQWAVEELDTIVDPAFIVNTGDLTDCSLGTGIPCMFPPLDFLYSTPNNKRSLNETK